MRAKQVIPVVKDWRELKDSNYNGYFIDIYERKFGADRIDILKTDRTDVFGVHYIAENVINLETAIEIAKALNK